MNPDSPDTTLAEAVIGVNAPGKAVVTPVTGPIIARRSGIDPGGRGVEL